MSLSPTLRPLPATQILDRGIRLYREHFVRLTLISVIAFFPFVLLAWLDISIIINPIISLLESVLVIPFLSAAFTSAGILIYQQGTFQYREVLQSGWKNMWRIIAVGFLEGLILVIPLFVVGAIAALMLFVAHADQIIIYGVIGIIMVPIAFFFTAKYAVAIPVIIAEKAGASTAMSRSWALTNRLFWHVTGIMILTSLLAVLINVLPTLISTYLFSMITIPIRNGNVAVASTLSALGLMITTPLRMVIIVALYVDLRIRQEGYDLEQALQQRAAEQTQDDPIPTA